MTERDEHREPLFRTLRVDLDGGGPAVPLSAAQRRAMTQRILAAARTHASAPVGPAAARATGGRRRLAALLVAATLVSVGALAALWVGSSSEAPARPEPRDRPAPASSRAPAAEAALEPTEAPAAGPALEEPAEGPPLQEPSDPSPAPRARPRPPRTPSDGLAAANALRAERRWAAAEQAYLAVARGFSASEQAYAARLAAADLQLAHTGRPTRALASYRAVLAARPRGALAAQARYGVARTLQRLGRVDEEREALEQFLAAHPDDLRAPTARARLAHLGR